jgi:glycosyltransferase involved in cell wall biosynthesis
MTSSPEPVDLAVAITTCNNIRTIERTLESVRGLARRVLVVDSGSDDGTTEACRSYGADVVHRDWPGPVDQKQFAIDQCRDAAWILVLDSDESLEPELRESMRRTIIENDQAFDGWRLNRKVYFRGGWLKYTFQPEWRVRLIRGNVGRVAGIGEQGLGGHDRIEVDGAVGRLVGDCRHDSWVDLADIGRRGLELAQRAGRHNETGGRLTNIVFSPIAAFSKQYVIKRGFRDGWRGLIMAGAVASSSLLKHLFIAERRAMRRDQGSGVRGQGKEED